MSEIVERVARAIYAVIPNGGEARRVTTAISQSGAAIYEKVFITDTWEEAPDRHDKCLEIARAAIAAMREPTPEMIAAIESMAEERFQAAPSFQRFYGDYLWRAGIDAAIAEKETK